MTCRAIIFFLLLPLFSIGQQADVDTCSWKPIHTYYKHRNKEDDFVEDKIKFTASAATKEILLSYIVRYSWGSCNDEGIQLGGHSWSGDTLRIYTYWCHAGDPSGHEWGGRIMLYKWNCTAKKFTKLSAKLYIEMMGVSGGFPLAGDNRDPEDIKARKEFERSMEKQYHARFVKEAEGYRLVDEVRRFHEKAIEAATKDWDKAYGPEGGAGSSFGYRK